MTIVAVDAGRTSCRVGVFTMAGGSLVPGPSVTRASTATIVDPDAPARITETVLAALAALGRLDQPGAATLVLAVAGRLAGGGPAEALADRLAKALPPGFGEIVVTSDVVAAHAAAFDGGPGVVLVAGTGAVALAFDAAGAYHLVDGGGYLVGDAGSGFAIGRAGLAAALRYEDRRGGGSAALAAAVAEWFAPGRGAPVRPREVVAGLHASADPVRRVASFAPEVAAAARAGDPVAAAIWRDAAAQLADTALAACRFLPGTPEVVLTGGLSQVEDLLVDPLRELVQQRRPEVAVRVGTGDALTGSARLAHRRGGYESLLLSRPAVPRPDPVLDGASGGEPPGAQGGSWSTSSRPPA